MDTTIETIDCACVIHGDLYSWDYVERLYAMLMRNFTCKVNLHVFTEADRPVPDYMIKHELVEWPGVVGRRRGWWYKMQMFNPDNFAGQLLYFDLDVVITKNLDWIRGLDPSCFWSIKDFKYLWRPEWRGINSSVMYWDTQKFKPIWQNFEDKEVGEFIQKYRGDQDYLSAVLDTKTLKFIDEKLVKSWRWEIFNGGLDMKTKIYRCKNAGAVIPPETCVVVFHGNPKPHEISDPIMDKYWYNTIAN